MSDLLLRMFEWNYDTGMVTELQRSGECNQCGQCCRAYVRFAGARDESPGTDKRGAWGEVTNGEKRYFIKLEEISQREAYRCPKLDGQAQCSVHATKATICKEWPFHPSHVAPFSECSYTFEAVTQWPIEEVGKGG